MESVLQTLIDLIGIDSPSGHEEEVRAFIVSRLSKLPIELTTDAAGNLSGVLPAFMAEREQTVLLNAHMDTIPSAVGVRPVVCGNTLASSGDTALGADNKTGIAVIITVLEALVAQSLSHAGIAVLFTVSEENGLAGAMAADVSLPGRIDRAYTLDSACQVGAVVCRTPYKSVISIVFHGKAVHAGTCPEKGISAISMAAEAVAAMKLLRIDACTTANVGSIHGGGGTNVVCDEVSIELEARSVRKVSLECQVADIRTCCVASAEKFGGTFSFLDRLVYPGYEILDDDTGLVCVQSACRDLGLPFLKVSSGGGSDVNVLRSHGLPALLLGAGYANAHSVSESQDILELDSLVKLVTRLVR